MGSFDLRIEQDFPDFFENDRFSAYITIKNFCNLLNNDWCVLKEVGYPRTDDVVEVDIVNGQYLFDEFVNPGGQSRATQASLWEARIGVRYEF